MKKLVYTTMLLLALTTVPVQAQNFMDRINFEVSAGSGIKNKGITPVDFSFKSLVEFVSISYLFVTVEDNISLYNKDEIKTYFNGIGIGGGIGVKLLNKTKCTTLLI